VSGDKAILIYCSVLYIRMSKSFLICLVVLVLDASKALQYVRDRLY
jgi:hypothetical protein